MQMCKVSIIVFSVFLAISDFGILGLNCLNFSYDHRLWIYHFYAAIVCSLRNMLLIFYINDGMTNFTSSKEYFSYSFVYSVTIFVSCFLATSSVLFYFQVMIGFGIIPVTLSMWFYKRKYKSQNNGFDGQVLFNVNHPGGGMVTITGLPSREGDGGSVYVV